jgi:isopropylmalate/homocitrate/citramalate synthase
MSDIILYDTTLRDGAQREGISYSIDDKLKIARRLDEFGVHYIEGGWPGSNPKDAAFFSRIRALKLRHAKIAAFGSTMKKGSRPEDDPNLLALLEAGTPVVTLVGKSWDLHVYDVLETSLEENLAMIAKSVAYIKAQGKEVIYDGEHFFDGYKANPGYALETLRAAAGGGAQVVVLCDTNGGTLPWEVEEVVRLVAAERLRGCQHPGSGARRGGARAGHDQRLRRAGGQRQPVHRHPRFAAQDGQAVRPRRKPGAAHPPVELRGGGRQPAGRQVPALCGRQRLRP